VRVSFPTHAFELFSGANGRLEGAGGRPVRAGHNPRALAIIELLSAWLDQFSQNKNLMNVSRPNLVTFQIYILLLVNVAHFNFGTPIKMNNYERNFPSE
jgi:hypothetical protein